MTNLLGHPLLGLACTVSIAAGCGHARAPHGSVIPELPQAWFASLHHDDGTDPFDAMFDTIATTEIVVFTRRAGPETLAMIPARPQPHEPRGQPDRLARENPHERLAARDHGAFRKRTIASKRGLMPEMGRARGSHRQPRDRAAHHRLEGIRDAGEPRRAHVAARASSHLPREIPPHRIPEDILDRIYFEENIARLGSGRDALDAAAALAIADAAVTLVVVAHADAGETNPRRLSERRAERVRNYLLSRGVSERHLTVRIMGAGQPLAGMSGPARDGAENRCVQLAIEKRSRP